MARSIGGIAGFSFGPTKMGRSSAALLVELPGIEPAALAGKMPSELSIPYVSFPFVPAHYLPFRFRVLTASRPDTPNKYYDPTANAYLAIRFAPRLALKVEHCASPRSSAMSRSRAVG